MPDPEGKMSSAQHDRLGELCFRYLDGVLGDAELAELNALMREFDEARALFAAYGQERFVLRDLLTTAHEETDAASILEGLASLDSTLADPPNAIDATDLQDDRTDIMSEVVDQALALRRQHELEDEANKQLAAQQAEDARERRFELARGSQTGQKQRVVVIPKAVVWLGLAAVLGLAVWIGHLATPPGPVEHVDSGEPAETIVHQDTLASAPPPPARLLASHRAVWVHDSAMAGADGSMLADTYRLDAGFLHLGMRDGAAVIVEGPATLTINDGSRVTLTTGVLSAYVPEGAEGFVVDTPAGRVLDLGTEFGVEVLGDEMVEVHVMDGEVVATLANKNDSRSMRVGDAGRMDRTAEQIEPVDVHAEKFARDWGQVERAVRVEGAVRFLYETPGSLRQGAIECDDLFYVLPERRGVAIDQEFACDFTQPGTYDRMPNADTGVALLPMDTRVDSYLLHYDRVGTPRELVAVHGVIHFDRPVVGIIVDDRRLMTTDAVFLDHDVQYPDATDATRGLEGLEHESNSGHLQDVVELSADRMTLTVNLATSTGIDQLRVLVEAGPDDMHPE